MARGYAIVRDENGRLIKTISHVHRGDTLQVQVADGALPPSPSKCLLDVTFADARHLFSGPDILEN
ncbi:MAG: hypothetical protein M5U34_25130, partial [Chloroflexi bacterium]|nr:hypothetical protein [Chloroflexota bacterium]